MTSRRPKTSHEHAAAYNRERRIQLRGLLVIAAMVLTWVLLRADRHAIFHPGWWRI